MLFLTKFQWFQSCFMVVDRIHLSGQVSREQMGKTTCAFIYGHIALLHFNVVPKVIWHWGCICVWNIVVNLSLNSLQSFRYLVFIKTFRSVCKGSFFQKVMTKFSQLSKCHSCEPKIVPEFLIPVNDNNKISVILWTNLVIKSPH